MDSMSDTDATDQLNEEIWNLAILGEPQAADALVRLVAGSRAIATACELENAALWAFVDALESDSDDIGAYWKKRSAAREALRQYEAKS
jgi:hypothetical protein